VPGIARRVGGCKVKTEREIRAHLEDLKVCVEKPCDCVSDGHAVECHIGDMMMRGNIQLLEWLLDLSLDYNDAVERFAESARR
jgi:hypothetical protein